MLQKQPPEVFCKKRCSQKFRTIHRKTPVLESLVLINLQIKKETLAPVKFAKFLSSLFFKEKLLATASDIRQVDILTIFFFLCIYGSNCKKCFVKKAVLRNVPKFTGKQIFCYGCFSVNFVTSVLLQNIFQRLLLDIAKY